MNIIVEYVNPPIAFRGADYCATFENYEPGDPVGRGYNKREAIISLMEAIDAEPTLIEEVLRKEMFSSNSMDSHETYSKSHYPVV
jgi:hypothetical protein